MFLLSINTIVGFVAGSVVTVVVPKVFAFVRKQITSVEEKAKAVTVASAEGAVKAAIAEVEKKL